MCVCVYDPLLLLVPLPSLEKRGQHLWLPPDCVAFSFCVLIFMPKFVSCNSEFDPLTSLRFVSFPLVSRLVSPCCICHSHLQRRLLSWRRRRRRRSIIWSRFVVVRCGHHISHMQRRRKSNGDILSRQHCVKCMRILQVLTHSYFTVVAPSTWGFAQVEGFEFWFPWTEIIVIIDQASLLTHPPYTSKYIVFLLFSKYANNLLTLFSISKSNLTLILNKTFSFCFVYIITSILFYKY